MTLSASEASARLAANPGWSVDDGALRKLYAFKSFPDAIAFVTRLAFDAEAADHHPDLQVNFRKVTVTWSTHSAGGLTEKDLDGARHSDRIAQAMGANF